MHAPRPVLTGLTVADPPERWRALGFAVDERQVALGGVSITLGSVGEGITGWSIHGLPRDASDVDGLPTSSVTQALQAAGPLHPNGATAIDHVVVVTPEFDRTADALQRAGLQLLRIREVPGGARQGFRRVGPAILELVEARQILPGPARFWGLVIVVADLEASVERLRPHLGPPQDAVQPGRRIATLARSAGLSPRVAFMTPER